MSEPFSSFWAGGGIIANCFTPLAFLKARHNIRKIIIRLSGLSRQFYGNFTRYNCLRRVGVTLEVSLEMFGKNQII